MGLRPNIYSSQSPLEEAHWLSPIHAQRAKEWPTPPLAVTSSASAALFRSVRGRCRDLRPRPLHPLRPPLPRWLDRYRRRGCGLCPRPPPPPPPSSMRSSTFSLTTSLTPHLTTAPRSHVVLGVGGLRGGWGLVVWRGSMATTSSFPWTSSDRPRSRAFLITSPVSICASPSLLLWRRWSRSAWPCLMTPVGCRRCTRLQVQHFLFGSDRSPTGIYDLMVY